MLLTVIGRWCRKLSFLENNQENNDFVWNFFLNTYFFLYTAAQHIIRSVSIPLNAKCQLLVRIRVGCWD